MQTPATTDRRHAKLSRIVPGKGKALIPIAEHSKVVLVLVVAERPPLEFLHLANGHSVIERVVVDNENLYRNSKSRRNTDSSVSASRSKRLYVGMAIDRSGGLSQGTAPSSNRLAGARYPAHPSMSGSRSVPCILDNLPRSKDENFDPFGAKMQRCFVRPLPIVVHQLHATLREY